MSDRPVVLVVEDDLEMNQLQCELLDVYGFDSQAAYTGAQALDLCDEETTDAVLLDLMLPEIDGYETCRRLKSQSSTDKLPVVMITAMDSDDCRQRGMDAGADAYFTKPFDPDQVISTLQLLIGANGG
ncbi:MAG: response regulator transcription factor [Phycisphaerales bacterium]|jgi:two-component system, cell cycle response regulator|nr:response regulator transcription factor [Phycisphaerales bacterium]